MTINGIVEGVAFFYGVEFHAGFQAMPHYFHDFDQCSAQSGDFCDDDGVAFFRFFEQSAQFSGLFSDLPADGFSDPFIDS